MDEESIITTGLASSTALEWDVIVLGSGGAGLSAAAVSALEGADVLVLEKSDLIGGTTALSGGGVWVPNNHHMAEVGVEDTPEEALQYLEAIGGGAYDEVIGSAFVENAPRMVRYLEQNAGMAFRAWPAIGGTLDYRPHFPGAKHGGRPLDPHRVAVKELGEWATRIRTGPGSAWVWDKLEFYSKRMHSASPAQSRTVHQRQFVDVGSVEYSDPTSYEFYANGTALVAQLLRACLKAGVELRTGCRATRLVSDGRGRVVGVVAEDDTGVEILVKARLGVVLATGGFEFNEELKKIFLNRPLDFSPGCPTNEGDGHLMGMAVGAMPANLADAWWCPVVPLGDDGDGEVCVLSREERALPHSMIVNSRGKRFVNESTNYHDITEAFGTRANSLKNLPAWLILDSQFTRKYALLKSAPPPKKGFDPGWLRSAPTLRELGEMIDVNGEALESTAAGFSEFARRGRDDDFSRGESAWDREWGDPGNLPNPALGTIEEGPFFAVELRPGALATKSGLQINGAGQVLAASHDRRVIPGLYAAGNVSSNAVPYGYTGPGATLGPALTFGYLIGRAIGECIARRA